MRKVLAFSFIVILVLAFWGCNNLEVKEDDVYVATSKLISANYRESVSFLSDSRLWVLQFENGMTVRIDIGSFDTNPGMFHVGSNYKIYHSPDDLFWKVQKE